MRSGGLDNEATFVRPGPPVRVGQSRVPGPDMVIAPDVPCRVTAGEGTERFANAENAATAPIAIYVRREEDTDQINAGDAAILATTRKRYVIKSVRPYSGDKRTAGGDPRRELEILAVGDGAL